MLQLAVIIVIIISIACGSYALVLLSRLRKLYRIDFLNSFFYYEILHLTFGLYGILGGLAIREILLKFDLESSQMEVIVMTLPFFGVPFIIAAWYLLIKTCNELINRKVPQYVSFIYFILATAIFFVYGLILRYDPDSRSIDITSVSRLIRIVFYSIELGVKLYLSIMLIIIAFKIAGREKRVFIGRFALFLTLLAALSAAALHFTYLHTIIGLYFLLLFFASDIALILLTKTYLSRNAAEYRDITDAAEDLLQKYGISRREKEIIKEICQGKTNMEIADELYISVQTVKDHTYNIFRKTNVRNRVQLTQLFSGIQ